MEFWKILHLLGTAIANNADNCNEDDGNKDKKMTTVMQGLSSQLQIAIAMRTTT
jgi:hypothetical protein